MLLLKRFISFLFTSSIKRAEKRTKACFDDYESLREKYKKLMEENNHSQVMASIHHIDAIEKSFKKGPTRTPITQNNIGQPNRPNSQPQPKPQIIPSAAPAQRPQTVQRRQTKIPHNGNTEPVRYTNRAPEMIGSPYVAPDQKKDGSSGGIFGVAAGLLSGSSAMEELVCEFCNAPNGSQPCGELKQFKCRECKQYNGIKHKKTETKKEAPDPNPE